eukprot:scaffold11542_cov60-Phaeocystis_antarctica.AAC.2
MCITTKPRSWYWGSHEQPVLRPPCAKPPSSKLRSHIGRMSSLTLAQRLACEIITPLGSPVEPDVNWRKAKSDGAASSSAGAAGSAALSQPSLRPSMLRHLRVSGQRQNRPLVLLRAITVESHKQSVTPHAVVTSAILVGRVDGNRDHARSQARPEHDKELRARRKAEQHPLAARAAPRAKQQLRQHACTLPERAKREHLGLGAPVVEPGEARLSLLPRHHARYLGEEARCVAKRPPPARPPRCHDLPQGGMGMRVGAKVRVLVRAHVRACVCEGWVLSGRAMLPAPMRCGWP